MKEAACPSVLGVNSAPQHSWVESLTPPCPHNEGGHYGLLQLFFMLPCLLVHFLQRAVSLLRTGTMSCSSVFPAPTIVPRPIESIQ